MLLIRSYLPEDRWLTSMTRSIVASSCLMKLSPASPNQSGWPWKFSRRKREKKQPSGPPFGWRSRNSGRTCSGAGSQNERSSRFQKPPGIGLPGPKCLQKFPSPRSPRCESKNPASFQQPDCAGPRRAYGPARWRPPRKSGKHPPTEEPVVPMLPTQNCFLAACSIFPLLAGRLLSYISARFCQRFFFENEKY